MVCRRLFASELFRNYRQKREWNGVKRDWGNCRQDLLRFDSQAAVRWQHLQRYASLGFHEKAMVYRLNEGFQIEAGIRGIGFAAQSGSDIVDQDGRGIPSIQEFCDILLGRTSQRELVKTAKCQEELQIGAVAKGSHTLAPKLYHVMAAAINEEFRSQLKASSSVNICFDGGFGWEIIIFCCANADTFGVHTGILGLGNVDRATGWRSASYL